MPNKTLAYKDEKCSNGKLSKERVTLLLGANCDGSEKLPVLMIGKSLKPRAFTNVKSLPLRYAANKKAWMRFAEWEAYLNAMDKIFMKQKRNVLFVVDNAPSHLPVEGLKNVKVAYLPPNTTSVTQPMDQGVIKNFKLFYRQLVVKKILKQLNQTTVSMASNVKIDLLDAVHFTKRAWDQVKSKTIANCFVKAGFSKGTEPINPEEVIDHDQTKLPSLWSEPALAHLTQGITLEEYIMVDETTTICEDITENAIIKMVESDVVHISDASDEDLDVDENVLPPVSSAEVSAALLQLRTFLVSRENTEEELSKLYLIENAIDTMTSTKLTQNKIASYFNA